MAARQPAASTLLKQAQARIEKLEKDLSQANSMKDHYYKQSTERQEEINQVHALIDALPGAVGRRVPVDHNGYAQDITLTAMTRLAAWLAVRPSTKD